MLSPELQVWIKLHGPKAAAEAANLADMFLAAPKRSQLLSNTTCKAATDTSMPTPPQNTKYTIKTY